MPKDKQGREPRKPKKSKRLAVDTKTPVRTPMPPPAPESK